MDLQLIPSGPLRLFVKLLWFSDGGVPGGRELVLPTGSMHLAIRLEDQPLHVYDSVDAATSRGISSAVVGGARAGFYVRDISRDRKSVV